VEVSCKIIKATEAIADKSLPQFKYLVQFLRKRAMK